MIIGNKKARVIWQRSYGGTCVQIIAGRKFHWVKWFKDPLHKFENWMYRRMHALILEDLGRRDSRLRDKIKNL